MGQFNAPGINKTKDAGEVAELLAVLIKELDFLNGYVDDKNIRANSITAELIKAGAISAEKIDVTELSAIAADLGTITAGLLKAVTIVGSLIQTAESGTYPRIELNSTTDLLKAESSATRSLSFDLGFLGYPMLRFISDSNSGGIFMLAGNMGVAAPNNISIEPDVGDVKVPSWARLVNVATSNTLQTDLNAKPAKGITTSETVGDGAGGTKTLNFTDGVLVSVT